MKKTTVGAYEAKTHLARLLTRVEGGERITITRHGVPVAVLVPATPGSFTEPREVAAELRRFRQGRRLAPVSLSEAMRAGRA